MDCFSQAENLFYIGRRIGWKEGGRDSRVTSYEGDVKVDIDDNRRWKGNKEIWKM